MNVKNSHHFQERLVRKFCFKCAAFDIVLAIGS